MKKMLIAMATLAMAASTAHATVLSSSAKPLAAHDLNTNKSGAKKSDQRPMAAIKSVEKAGVTNVDSKFNPAAAAKTGAADKKPYSREHAQAASSTNPTVLARLAQRAANKSKAAQPRQVNSERATA